MEKKRKSREKPESFIGKTFNSGTLKVTGIIGSTKYGNKIYSVTCDICSQDKELFPDGHFTSTKRQLEQGQIPCGCSKCPHYTKDQFFVLVKREGMLRNFTVESMNGEYKNTQTKLNLKCKIDNNEWITNINSILYKKSGCPECNSEKLRNKYKTSEEVAIEKCKQICEIMNYTFIRFIMGYKNSKSRFEYVCPKHGVQESCYTDFVHCNNMCNSCGYDVIAEKLKIPEPVAFSRCVSACDDLGYTFIGFKEGYKNSESIVEYKCPIHDLQLTNYTTLIHKKSGCPRCAKHGYNVDKPGSFYIVKWKSAHHSFIKFGITNREVLVRLEEQRRNTNYTYTILLNRYWKDGKIADYIEKSVKKSNMFNMNIVHKENFPDGFTETIDIKEEYKLLEFVKSLPFEN